MSYSRTQTIPLLSLKLVSLQSQVYHSATEPLHSYDLGCKIIYLLIRPAGQVGGKSYSPSWPYHSPLLTDHTCTWIILTNIYSFSLNSVFFIVFLLRALFFLSLIISSPYFLPLKLKDLMSHCDIWFGQQMWYYFTGVDGNKNAVFNVWIRAPFLGPLWSNSPYRGGSANKFYWKTAGELTATSLKVRMCLFVWIFTSHQQYLG